MAPHCIRGLAAMRVRVETDRSPRDRIFSFIESILRRGFRGARGLDADAFGLSDWLMLARGPERRTSCIPIERKGMSLLASPAAFPLAKLDAVPFMRRGRTSRIVDFPFRDGVANENRRSSCAIPRSSRKHIFEHHGNDAPVAPLHLTPELHESPRARPSRRQYTQRSPKVAVH